MLRRTPYVSVGGRKPPRIARKATDNTPITDNKVGPVEWIPRPVRMTYQTIYELQDIIMRQQLDGAYQDINRVRDMHRQWGGGMPMKPALGDVEPKFPRGVYKHGHIAHVRFKYRWHKANSPNHWAWLPGRPGGISPAATAADESRSQTKANSSDGTEMRWQANSDAPENWQRIAERKRE